MTRIATRAAIVAGLQAYGPLLGSGSGGTWPETRGPQILAWPNTDGIEAGVIFLTGPEGEMELRAVMMSPQGYRDRYRFKVWGQTPPRPYSDAATLGQALLTGLVAYFATNPGVGSTEGLVVGAVDGPDFESSADGQGVVARVLVEVEITETIWT